MRSNWLFSQEYSAAKTLQVYKDYIEKKGSLDDLVFCFVDLAHTILRARYSSVTTFDREDLLAVAVESVIKRVQGCPGSVFNVAPSEAHEAQMTNYAYRWMLSGIYTHLQKFNMTTSAIDPSYTASRANKRTASPEHIYAVQSYFTLFPACVVSFMKKHNRFELTEELIRYFVVSVLRREEISQKILKTTFKRVDPAADVDNLQLLYRWALYDCWDEFSVMQHDTELEELVSRSELTVDDVMRNFAYIDYDFKEGLRSRYKP